MPAKKKTPTDPSPDLHLADGQKVALGIDGSDRAFLGETLVAWRQWCLAGMQVDQLLDWRSAGGVEIYDVRIGRCRTGGAPIQIVVRATHRKKKVVAFHRCESIVEGLRDFLDRYEAEAVDWKDDEQRSAEKAYTNGSAALSPAVV